MVFEKFDTKFKCSFELMPQLRTVQISTQNLAAEEQQLQVQQPGAEISFAQFHLLLMFS